MSEPHTMLPPDPVNVATVTVAASGTASTVLDCAGHVPVALITPAALTSTALTLKAGISPDALLPVHETTGSALSITVAAGRFIPLPPSSFSGMLHLQLVCGSAEAAGRTFQVLLRKLG